MHSAMEFGDDGRLRSAVVHGGGQRRRAVEFMQRSSAIVHRRREVDVSPWIQKIGTRVRPLLPTLVDRRIYAKTKTMRSAFEPLPELRTG